MNLESLHALSTDMLLEMAGRLGLELPAGLERPFIIEEILDAQEDESGQAIETSLNSLSSVDGFELPATPVPEEEKPENDSLNLQETRYNESSIQALLKDPCWAYLYWDIREEEIRDAGEAEAKSVCIRVLELACAQDAPKNALSWFDLCVSERDKEWYVNLPEDGVCYVFELALHSGRDRKVLARSNVLKTPKLRKFEDFLNMPKKTRTLMELAGFYEYLPPPESGQPGFDACRGQRILPISESEE